MDFLILMISVIIVFILISITITTIKLNPTFLFLKVKHIFSMSGHLDLTHNLQVKLLSLLFLFFKNNSTNNLF